MKHSILVRGARQLLTLHGPSGPRRGEALGELGIIEDGSVLIVDGVITNVGPTRRIENLAEARNAEEINASAQVVMPGFIDSHTHLLSAPARLTEYRRNGTQAGMKLPLPDSPAVASIVQYVRNTPAGTLEFNARRYLESCLRHGTTTIEVKTGYGLNGPGELKMLRVLASLDEQCSKVIPTFLGAQTTAPEYDGRQGEYMSWLCNEFMPRLRGRRAAHFVDILCSPEGFGIEESRAYLDCGRRLGLDVKVHADQTSHTEAVNLALDSEATSVDGLNWANQEDAVRLGNSRTVATLMPATVHQNTYSRFPPARLLIDSGAAVALATGFQPSVCSTLSMQMVISLACTHMGMTPEEAISASTINGAHALGQGQRCGSLESGKEADLILLGIQDYRELPFYFGSNLVNVVMRKGRTIFREGAVECGVP